MPDEKTLPCKEKISFRTKEEAKAGAVVAKWQHDVKLKVYLCKYCDLWHLSSM